MNGIPVQVLEMKTFEDVFNDVPVFNVDTIEYYLWFHLPIEISRDCQMYEVHKFDNSSECTLIPNFHRFCKRFGKRPWYRVTSAILDKSEGQHTYKLCFINTLTDDVFSLYVSYIVQTNNPDTPYIYVNRDN